MPNQPRRIALLAVALCLAAAAQAAAFPTTGPQRLLVIPVEYAHTGCPADQLGVPTCPRNTAAELQTRIDSSLRTFYETPATGFKVSWQVKVLVNPATANGWWPAPSTPQQLAAGAAAKKDVTWAGTPSSVGDAMRIVLGRAIAAGVITAPEALGYTRVLAVHNWHTFGGQSAGQNPIAYTTTVPAAKGTFLINPFVTVAWVNEGTGNDEMLNVAEHELAHELGPGDFYGDPCNLQAPGDILPLPVKGVQDAECTWMWDVMGYTPTSGRNTGFGYLTRALLGWVDTAAGPTRYETAAFNGPISISSVEYPNGDPLALHFPQDPGRLVLARAFGQPGFFNGYLVECRRTKFGDTFNPPGTGVVISWVDTTRSHPQRQQVIVRSGYTSRPGVGVSLTDAFLWSGKSWTSPSGDIHIEHVKFNDRGGCDLFVNRKTRVTVTPLLVPVVARNDPTSVVAFGGTVPKAVYANPGLVVNGPTLPKRTAAITDAGLRSALALHARGPAKVTAPAVGKPSVIRFTYGNGGGASGAGRAVVRVQQPWVASPACGRTTPAGRIVGTVRLPALASGAAGTASVRWRPRSIAPAAISVTYLTDGAAVSGQTVTSVVAFATARRARGGKVGEIRTRLLVEVPRRCTEPVPVVISPTIVPKGWRVRLIGAGGPFRPGTRRAVTVAVTPPRGVRPAVTDIPVSVSFGTSAAGTDPLPAENAAAMAPVPLAPAPEETVGIDLLTRVAAPGKAPPPFVIPAFAGMGAAKATSPAQNINTEPAGQPQQLAITDCATAGPPPVGSLEPTIVLSGTLAPLRPQASITITYTAPGQTTVTHTVTTDAAGGSFQDTFDRQGVAWSAAARTDDAVGFAPATSSACAVPVP